MTKKVDQQIEELEDVYASAVVAHQEGDRRVQFASGDEQRRRMADLHRRKEIQAGGRPKSISLARFSRG